MKISASHICHSFLLIDFTVVAVLSFSPSFSPSISFQTTQRLTGPLLSSAHDLSCFSSSTVFSLSFSHAGHSLPFIICAAVLSSSFALPQKARLDFIRRPPQREASIDLDVHYWSTNKWFGVVFCVVNLFISILCCDKLNLDSTFIPFSLSIKVKGAVCNCKISNNHQVSVIYGGACNVSNVSNHYSAFTAIETITTQSCGQSVIYCIQYVYWTSSKCF